MIKTYTKRDTATAALRKLGIAKENYNHFIVLDNGNYNVNLDAAETSLKKPAEKARASTTKSGAQTVASVARGAITDGNTNAEVWKILCDKFPAMTEKQKGYPAWYRSEMKRKEKK